MAKTSKISYKTYYNERLKKIDFHGELVYPLYVQVTYDRRTIFFKSYYFELFSKQRYQLLLKDEKYSPSIKAIIKKEMELVGFVVNLLKNDFSLDNFKREYSYYSKDLCDITEPDFIEYIYTFLHDKGMPNLAWIMREGCNYRIPYDIIQDLKISMDKKLLTELIDNSFHYSTPYLSLFEFMKKAKKWPMLSLSIMEWEQDDIKNSYNQFLANKYPNNLTEASSERVDYWIKKYHEV